jgi:hypothetical protein
MVAGTVAVAPLTPPTAEVLATVGETATVSDGVTATEVAEGAAVVATIALVGAVVATTPLVVGAVVATTAVVLVGSAVEVTIEVAWAPPVTGTPAEHCVLGLAQNVVTADANAPVKKSGTLAVS